MNYQPLISVIIPCYNHAAYLPGAINSVLKQTYQHFEIIVVDDGSKDNTKNVALSYPVVKYVYQQNQGLAAARNTGVKHAQGAYILFSDADDWLYEDALQNQLCTITKNNNAMAVAGGHNKVTSNGDIIPEEENLPQHKDHYLDLLQGNFIGMHGAVMYKREVFKEFQYDVTLKAAEDYDFYLRLARKYPIAVHQKKIAAYVIHGENMSKNIPLMLHYVLHVLSKQQDLLQSPEEKKAFAQGVKNWKDYYSQLLINSLKKSHARPFPSKKEFAILLRNQPYALIKLYPSLIKNDMKSLIKKAAKKILGINTISDNQPVPVGKINWGNFSRTKPFSDDFGYDRGGPVDRYYIESFLQKNAADIKGRVLEIGDNAYTMQFGNTNVAKSDVLHIYPDNPAATIVGDLSKANEIPIADNTFDCIVLTQTLHLIYDFHAAIQQCHRILKPGGVLLLTVPGISHIDSGDWGKNWLWSFNTHSITKIMEEDFKPGEIEIKNYGNVMVATAFIWGVGLTEIKQRYKLDQHDPSYQVIISVRAKKL